MQLLDGVKFICYHVQQLLTLPGVLFNIKFLMTYFFAIADYTLLQQYTAFCFLVTLWKKLLYRSYFAAFMLNVWERLQTIFQNDVTLPSRTPQIAILGLNNERNYNYNPLSYILLIFKQYIYMIKGETHTKQRYYKSKLNKSKEKANKPCYH